MSINNKPTWSSFFKLWPAIFLLSLCLSCEGPGGVRYIKLGHGLDTSHPVHEAMVFLAERVEEKSGGEMVVQVYPNQQLGTERELMELLQIGSVGMTKVSTAVVESFAPKLQVLSQPYIFRDDEHRRRRARHSGRGTRLCRTHQPKQPPGHCVGHHRHRPDRDGTLKSPPNQRPGGLPAAVPWQLNGRSATVSRLRIHFPALLFHPCPGPSAVSDILRPELPVAGDRHRAAITALWHADEAACLEPLLAHDVELPITAEVYRVAYERKPPERAMIDLMTREGKAE